MEGNKKKIMCVIHALGYGGAGKMIVCLANALAELGKYKIVLYVEEHEGKHYPVHPDVEIYQEREYFTNYYTRHFQQIFQLRKRVKEINPDLVISFQTNQNALSVLATRGRNIPVIVSERGDPYQYHNIVAYLKTKVINMAEGGVFQTHKAMEYYGKGLQKRSCVILNPNTVPAIERPCWEDRVDEIAFVARFDIYQKRQDLMIEAFRLIADKNKDIKLAFYGEGKEKLKIQELSKQYELTDRVLYKGLVRNIPQAIKTAKVFVMTSDFEGLPNALIEAMATGLACVSTDCSPGGAAALITNGVNGYIVPCNNAEAVADRVLFLLENPMKADELGKEAQKITDVMKPTRIFGEWEEYIKTFIG